MKGIPKLKPMDALIYSGSKVCGRRIAGVPYKPEDYIVRKVENHDMQRSLVNLLARYNQYLTIEMLVNYLLYLVAIGSVVVFCDADSIQPTSFHRSYDLLYNVHSRGITGGRLATMGMQVKLQTSYPLFSLEARLLLLTESLYAFNAILGCLKNHVKITFKPQPLLQG